MSKIERILSYSPEKWWYVWALFIVLCINKLGYYPSGGEECLTFAKQWYNPGWIPGSFSLNNPEPSRSFFYNIMGFVLEYFNFEQTIFLGRLVNFFLYAIPLGFLLKKVNFSLMEAFVLLQIFIWGRQAFFGGEWLFYTFEPKTLAYVGVFWALYFLHEKKYYWLAISLVIASYMHLLVAFWFIVPMIPVLWFKSGIKEALLFSMRCLLGCGPFALYILFQYSEDTHQASAVADWIFCYFRLANHIGIFDTVEYFINYHFPQVLTTAIVWIVAAVLMYMKKLKGSFITLMMVILSINLFYVFIAYIDHKYLGETCSLGLKFFPFRMSSIAYFLLHLVVFLKLKELLISKEKLYNILLLLFGLFLTGVLIGEGIENYGKSSSTFNNESFHAISKYIKKDSAKEDDFILEGIDQTSVEYMTFIRRAERDQYFIEKFVPATDTRLIEWYNRSLQYDEFLKDWKHIYTINKNLADPIEYILTTKELDLELIHQEGEYRIYSI